VPAADSPAVAPAVVVANSMAPAAAPAASPARNNDADSSPAVVLAVIESWRAAWSSRDVTRYLSLYAADFAPPGGLTRAKWEAQRRERLKRASFISLKVLDPQVTVTGDKQAAARFTQVYESDTIKESGRKLLALVQQGGKWLIRGETFEK
jgi:ketosteroid isomerase-like protein